MKDQIEEFQQQKKLVNTIEVDVIENGEVVQHIKTENTVSQGYVNFARSTMYSYASTYLATESVPGAGNTQCLALLDDNYTVSPDGFSLDLWKLSNTPAYFINNPSYPTMDTPNFSHTTGLCNALNTSSSGSKGGVYLPSRSGLTGRRSITNTYEFGTTQANGVIKSIAYMMPGEPFSTIGLGSSNSPAELLLNPLQGLTYTRYIGYKTSGSDKHLYFRQLQETPNNNIIIINETDGTLVGNDTLVTPASKDEPSILVASVLETVYCNNNFITLTNSSNSQLTYKKAPESTLVYGDDINVSFTQLGTGTVHMSRLTADEQYLYILAQDSTNVYIIKIDTTTDLVASMIDLGAYAAAFAIPYSSSLFNVCPFSGKIFFGKDIANTPIYVLAAGATNGTDIIAISKPYIRQGNYSGYLDLYYEKNGKHFTKLWTPNVQLTSIDPSNPNQLNLMTAQAISCCIYEVQGRGNFLTYADLPTPITKNSNQVVRIQYTLSW